MLLRRAIGKFAGNRDGNIAIAFGLLIIPLLIAGGMALDFARKAQASTVIQEASDSALLRAARMRSLDPNATDAELTDLARRIFDAATATLQGVTIDAFNVTFDNATEAFQLNIDGDMDTTLMGAVGVNTLEIDTISEVKLGDPPYLEVVLALDNTGSMNDNGKLASLKTSANMLVDTLFGQPDAEVMVGLVPFAQYVNVGDENEPESWMGAAPAGWNGCVGSRNFPSNTEDADYAIKPIPAIDGGACPQKILPLSTNHGAATTAINAMTGSGNTYIASGLAWGWRALSDRAPFDQGVTKAQLEAKNGVKVLILLTDGENTRAPSYPEHESTDTTLADDMTDRLCDAVKADDVILYTIAFDVSDPLIRNLMQDCGTTPGHYFAADNAAQLNAAFQDIATSLRNLSLSK